MDQFPIPNRQRRKSNLGRRNRTNENVFHPMPVFQVPVARGLGRSLLSDKKAHSRVNISNASAETLCAKKRLFLLSPLPSSILQVGTAKALQEGKKYLHKKYPNDITLNETGVQELVTTPSPNIKDNTISHNVSKETNKTERPKSLGMSQYNQLIFSELANLKPPVDPDDKVDVVKSPSPENSSDELDTTNSFLLTEQTINDQTLTESPQFKKPVSVSKSGLNSCRRLDPVVEEETESDTEDELLQQTLSKLNMMMDEIENTKKIVHSIIKKKLKRRTKVENKENDKTAANITLKDKWMSELKSDNPSLLKTPKPLKKQRPSIAEQSMIWTPHSLSTVLIDQMDDLFE